MKFLGFYIGGHDSNMSYSDDHGRVRYFKLERLIQRKHKKGSVGWVADLCREHGLVPDAVCFSDGNRNGLGCCARDVLAMQVAPIPGLFDVPTFCIDHHYGHILSGWPAVHGDCRDIQRGICLDGRGDNQVRFSVIQTPFNLPDAEVVHSDTKSCVGQLLNQVGCLMRLDGGELDYAGKIMGAYAYGHICEQYVCQCRTHLTQGDFAELLQIRFCGEKIEDVCLNRDSKFFDWVSSLQHVLGEYVMDLFSRYAVPNQTMYAGGCAQNTVYNELLDALYRPIIPPHCYDGGISIGCVGYLSLYYGIGLDITGFPFSQEGEDLGYADGQTVSRVCDYLEHGKIVGWCQGRAEIGPRALGHRSILMDPSIVNCKDILNARIKKREFWRPFAGSLLIEDGPMIMSSYHACPYMLHAMDVAPQWRSRIPGIVHADGTCRFQTVGDEYELRSYRRLIEEFKSRTGTPAILNTSYNVSGKPIANDRLDIVNAFQDLDLDVLCVGNEIIEKGKK